MVTNKIKMLIKIVGVVLAVLLLLFFIYNLIYGFRTIRGVGRARCAAKSATNYIEHGGYLKNLSGEQISSSLYIGNLGLMSYLASLRTELSSLQLLSSSTLTTITNEDLSQKNADLTLAFTNFFQNYAS